MSSFNSVVFVGNAGKDCEMNYTPEGVAVSKFSLAVNEYAGKDASGKAKESTMWLNIVAWRNTAEVANKYIVKGTPVLVSGKLSIRDYTDKNGVKRQSVEVIASDIRLLGSKPSSSNASIEDNPLAGFDEHPF